jgi:hypothetical protein
MTKSNHYVDNEVFLKEMTEYRNAVHDAQQNKLERPRVPNYIGTCLFKIATHLSRRPNFARYTFREDMISDGVENCLLYIDNFDPEKSKNPFAYFTQIIYFAFLRRIQKEKKHMYVKYKSMENEVINALIENTGEGEDMIGSQLNGSMHDSYAEEFIRDFIESFEETKRKKTIARKKKTGITKFMEEDDADTIASTN